MTRVQFFPEEAFYDYLVSEAKRQKISLSTYVLNTLKHATGYENNNETTENEAALALKVYEEVEAYINAQIEMSKSDPVVFEFDLLRASPTFSSFPMVDGSRPNPKRGRFGRYFAKALPDLPYGNYTTRALTVSGKPKKSANNSAVYQVCYSKQ